MFGQAAGAHQVFIDGPGGFAALGYGPDHQRLASAHVAGGEDSALGGVVIVAGFDVASRVEVDSELLDHAILDGAEEAHSEQHEIDVHGEFAPRDRFELRPRADPDSV